MLSSNNTGDYDVNRFREGSNERSKFMPDFGQLSNLAPSQMANKIMKLQLQHELSAKKGNKI